MPRTQHKFSIDPDNRARRARARARLSIRYVCEANSGVGGVKRSGRGEGRARIDESLSQHADVESRYVSGARKRDREIPALALGGPPISIYVFAVCNFAPARVWRARSI